MVSQTWLSGNYFNLSRAFPKDHLGNLVQHHHQKSWWYNFREPGRNIFQLMRGEKKTLKASFFFFFLLKFEPFSFLVETLKNFPLHFRWMSPPSCGLQSFPRFLSSFPHVCPLVYSVCLPFPAMGLVFPVSRPLNITTCSFLSFLLNK